MNNNTNARIVYSQYTRAREHTHTPNTRSPCI